MRQRIVIELEGEEPPLEDLSDIVKGTVTRTVLNYKMSEIRDFSIRREILPEEMDGEIRMPEFLNKDKMCQQVQDGMEEVLQGKEAVQDG